MNDLTTITDNRLRVEQVDAVLHPKSIALVGASPKAKGFTNPILSNLKRFGYAGEITGVNPGYKDCNGIPCYPDIASIPNPPDQLVFLVAPERIRPILADGAARGARSAVIISGGFGAEEAEGPRLSRELQAEIERTGIAVCGPNCMGNVSTDNRAVTLADTRFARLDPGPVALVSQSGGILTAQTRALIDRDTGFSYLISTGNQFGLDIADYIAYLNECPKTKVIGLFIEGLPRPQAFLEACRRCTENGKPIVVLKVGGSEAGREGAATHTGVLAGTLAVFRAAVENLDVTVVDNLDQMIETIELYKVAPRLPRLNPGIGVVTFSGGLRNLILDAAERSEIPFPPFAPATVAKIEKHIPRQHISNPLDSAIFGPLPPDAYRECMMAVISDPSIDMVVVQEELPRTPGQPTKEENLRNMSELAKEVGKPIVALSMLSHNVTDHGRAIRQTAPHIAFLQEVEKGLRTVASWRKRRRAIAAAQLPRSLAAPERIDAWKAKLSRSNGKALNETESKKLLADWGVSVVREQLCQSAEEAISAAETMGYPVVLKVVSQDILHKTEVGGVRLNITSREMVRNAFCEILSSATAMAPSAVIDGVLVGEMVKGGFELACGIHRDAEFGATLMLSAGGTLVELLADATFMVPPLDAAAADRMISRLKAASILDGIRGSEKLDNAAVRETLLKLSALVKDIGDYIESADINPLLVLADGRGCRVLDAVIVPRAVARHDDRQFANDARVTRAVAS